MSLRASIYDPPRAGWRTRWRNPWFAIRRRWQIDIIKPSWLASPFWSVLRSVVLLGVTIPGFGFWASNRRAWAMVAWILYAGCALLFLAWIGQMTGGVFYGLMIFIHLTGTFFLLNQLQPEADFGQRIRISLIVFAMVLIVIYAPIRQQIEKHLVLPLNTQARLILVNPRVAHSSLRRGDVIAYQISGSRYPVYMNPGYAIERVLATSGDLVRFTPESYYVNGVAHPREPFMPSNGEIVVSEKQCFIWPTMVAGAIHDTQRGLQEQAVATVLKKIAFVSDDQWVGTPYKRWFWRQQIFP